MKDGQDGKRPIRPQAFTYQKPTPENDSKREIVRLCQTPGLRGAVHVIRTGGGENLHSHSTVDGFWMVLSGRVAFYGDDDHCFGEFGPLEGILMPKQNRYRFECMTEGDAEILQLLHIDEQQGFKREEHEPEIIEKSDIPVFYGIKRGEGKRDA
ncbi:MAG: hypothetical protein AAGI11_11300 [Pseudomonadota bacterium]